MAANARLNKQINRWAARVAPAIIIGVAGYVTYTVPVSIGVNYLLNPPPLKPVRRGAGIAVIVIYFVIFTVMIISYLRLFLTIQILPGYVPKPDPDRAVPGIQGHDTSAPTDEKGYLDRGAISNGREPPPPGLDQFWKRDVFECEVDGMPRWCSTCKIWKPDRSHHCSEVGRCVYKMDHFCPWAGGIVSETSFKFFLQYVIYGTIYATFVLIVSSYFTADVLNKGYGYNPHWVATIAFGAFFFLFGLGMSMNSTQLATINTTTVDSLTQKSRVTTFAVLLPDNLTLSEATAFQTITYPIRGQAADQRSSSGPTRTFAILSTPQGRNPYQLRTPRQDLKSVLGNRWYEWLLPISQSPCYLRRLRCEDVENGRGESLYKLGPLMDKIRANNGLGRLETDERRNKRARRHSLTPRGEHSNGRHASPAAHHGGTGGDAQEKENE